MNATTHGQPGYDAKKENDPRFTSTSAAPLGAATSGRLVFTSGATGVAIKSDPSLAELYRAHFAQPTPGIYLEHEPEGTRPAPDSAPRKVTIHYRHQALDDWLARRGERLAVITLNASIPWEIEFCAGVAHLTADLRALLLRSFDLSACSGARMLLPRPSGTVYLHFGGSASNVTLWRPLGVSLRAQFAGSVSRLRIDTQSFGAVAQNIAWQTPDYDAATDRYDIRFAGSVSDLTIVAA